MEILGRKLMNFRSCSSPKRDFTMDRNKRGQSQEDGSGPSAKKPMIVREPDGSIHTVVKEEVLDAANSDDNSNAPASPEECHVALTLPNRAMAKEVILFAQNYLFGEVGRGAAIDKKYLKQLGKQLGE